MFRTTLRRSSPLTCSLRASPRRVPLLRASPPVTTGRRAASLHAISNPELAGIEKRWEGMPPQEQADLWMALRDRMKVDWKLMTVQEKKAAYWIAFGPHGPRALPPPGQAWKVLYYTMFGVGVSFVIFWILQSQARKPPSTMNKEYQMMTNEYLKNQNTEPITGVSSENYKGKGMVQSGPKRDKN